MKTAISYINNHKGQPRAVQLPISQWTKLMNKLNKYEQMLSLKSDLTKAFADVKKMQQGKTKKQSLQEFLHEL